MAFWSAALPVIGQVASGFLGSSGAKKAAAQEAQGIQQGIDFMREAHQDQMGMAREQFDYGQEQDVYSRLFGERAYQQGLGGYHDQYEAYRIAQEQQRQQLAWQNAIQQHALGGLSQYMDMGLGNLGGLLNFGGRSPQASLGQLSPQGHPMPNRGPAPGGGPMGNPFVSPGQISAPGLAQLPAAMGSQVAGPGEFMPLDEIEQMVMERIAARSASTGQNVEENLQKAIEDPTQALKEESAKAKKSISNMMTSIKRRPTPSGINHVQKEIKLAVERGDIGWAEGQAMIAETRTYRLNA